MAQKNCASCAFIDLTTDRPFCRRYPPQLVVTASNDQNDNGVRRFFPVVDPNADWCGEHVAAKLPRKAKKADASAA